MRGSCVFLRMCCINCAYKDYLASTVVRCKKICVVTLLVINVSRTAEKICNTQKAHYNFIITRLAIRVNTLSREQTIQQTNKQLTLYHHRVPRTRYNQPSQVENSSNQ